MKQLHFYGKNKLGFIEVPDPQPNPGEVIVKTVCSAICGSEMHAYREGMAEGNPGHEAVGIIEAVGEGVTSVKVGQRVGASPIAGCGECDFCRKGQYTWCPDFRFFGSFHSEKFRAAANAVQILPDDVEWDSAVLLTGDGFGVPYHTAQKVWPQSNFVAIFGAGPIGLGNVIMQHYLGRKIAIVDICADRLDFARQLGADWVINPAETDVVAEIKRLTNGLGADLCLECAGRPETVRNCFDAVRTGGQVIFNGEQGSVPLSISEDYIRRDITACGSWFYHFGEFSAMLELFRKGLPVGELISHRFSFEEAPEAYSLFAAGKTAKVLMFYP